jgi:hypothetical protein
MGGGELPAPVEVAFERGDGRLGFFGCGWSGATAGEGGGRCRCGGTVGEGRAGILCCRREEGGAGVGAGRRKEGGAGAGVGAATRASSGKKAERELGLGGERAPTGNKPEMELGRGGARR